MNSLFGRFRLVAAAMCGIAVTLVGCNAIEDVREAPSTPLPKQLDVLGGTIDGLGYRRPVVLEDQGALRCPDSTGAANKAYCTVTAFGNFNEEISKFTFGSVPVGTPFNIKVKSQPFGKTCTVDPTLSQGVVSAGSQIDVPVTCANVPDSVVHRYCVGGILTQAMHDIPGLRITLSSEEGLTTLSNDSTANADGPLPAVTTTGTCWFDPTRYPKAGVFNNGTSVPVFKWYVTATFPTVDSDGTTQLTNNCRVTGGGSGTGSNDTGGDTTLPPTADVTSVSIAACDFQISGTLGYSQQAGVTFVNQTISGLQLQLQDAAGNVVKDKAGNAVTYDVPAYAVTNPATTQSFTFGGTATPNRLLSNPKAVYDVVVTHQPTGMFCVVSDSYVARPTATNTTPYTIAGGAGARLATPVIGATFVTVAPASLAWPTYADVPTTSLSVRCRATPGTATNASTVLTGTYQRTNLASSTATTPTVTRTLDRDFLTFFDDGTFLYGTRNAVNSGVTSGQGVERGFYYYDTTAKTISFSVLTDTNNNVTFSAGLGNITTAGGISAVPAATLTNVVKSSTSPNRITAHVSGPTNTTTNGVTVTTNVDWELNEVKQTAGKMRGSWVTDDHRRVWVYDDNTIFGFHVGVNGGAANLQDACYILYNEAANQDADAVKGFYSRRGTSTTGGGDLSAGSTSQSSTGCPSATTTSFDSNGVPTIPTGVVSSTADIVDAVNNNSTTQEAFLATLYPAIPFPYFLGRIPGGQGAYNGRSPSPSPFLITPGTPDSVTVSATMNGVPISGSSATFRRNQAVPAP